MLSPARVRGIVKSAARMGRYFFLYKLRLGVPFKAGGVGFYRWSGHRLTTFSGHVFLYRIRATFWRRMDQKTRGSYIGFRQVFMVIQIMGFCFALFCFFVIGGTGV